MILNSGFPPRCKVAPYNKRYKGYYYYSAYWSKWDKVIDVKERTWVVQNVDLYGNPIGPVREHCTDMWIDRFANKPFKV